MLVFGKGFFVYTLERDQAEIDALMNAENTFWQHVEGDTPPMLDGTDATADALTTIYGESRSESIELFGRGALLEEHMRLKAQKKEIEDRMGEIENIIKGNLGGGASILRHR